MKVGKVKRLMMLLGKENLLVWDFQHHRRNTYPHFITAALGRKNNEDTQWARKLKKSRPKKTREIKYYQFHKKNF